MGIESHPFRGTVLTGSAAREFFRQVNNGYVSPAAKGSLIRGAAMSAELNATGSVRLRPRTERKRNMNGEPSGGR
jgi:hypothetical protein